MNRRPRREGSVLTSPVLVGALTVLVTIVAVTLAYNANQGLPFVPKYTVNVQIRDASEVTRNADVRIGGSQVGFVNKVTASRDSSGRPIAVVNLKLQKSVEPLSTDSRVIVRLKGAIGLKYIEIDPGDAVTKIPDGATVPLTQASSTVDLDQVLSMFTPATRVGVAKSTIGYGVALAGRGSDLNNTIVAFLPLLRDLAPVARNLSSSRTDLGGFFRGLESFSSALVPVANTQANLYTNLAATFDSLATVAHPFLQEWISDTPPEFTAVIQNSPTIQAFLLDTAAFFRESLPGAQTIPQSAPVLADAFAIGTRTLPGTAELDKLTVSLSKHIAAFGETPAVQQGLDRVTLTSNALAPPLQFLTPMQSTCNYVSLFLRNLANALSTATTTGTTLNVLPVAIGDVLGGESVASQKPYLTPGRVGDQQGPLHVDPYPNTDAPGQTPECSAGNEPYSPAAARIGNPPGNVGLKTEVTKRSRQ
jgi:ABC-type transporter Mla subunit MlaD